MGLGLVRLLQCGKPPQRVATTAPEPSVTTAHEPSDISILKPQLSQLTLAAPATKPLAEQLTPSNRVACRVVASQSGGFIAYSEQDSR